MRTSALEPSAMICASAVHFVDQVFAPLTSGAAASCDLTITTPLHCLILEVSWHQVYPLNIE